jgi:DNA-binding IclR family transcriptional regulator
MPMTAGEVSQQTELPTSTTTRVLDRLEKHGLIERTPDPADRRRVVVRALPGAFAGAGRGGRDDPYGDILAGMQRLHEQFTIEELEVVARYLDALKDVR